jgi:hypothetical protein
LFFGVSLLSLCLLSGFPVVVAILFGPGLISVNVKFNLFKFKELLFNNQINRKEKGFVSVIIIDAFKAAQIIYKN